MTSAKPTTLPELLERAADHIQAVGHMRVGPYTGAWYYFGSENNDRRRCSASLTGAIRIAGGVPVDLLTADHDQQPLLVRQAVEAVASVQTETADAHTAVFEINELMICPGLAVATLRHAAEKARSKTR